MKTTFTLILLSVMSLFHGKAQAVVNSKLHLNLFDHGNFTVVIDGIRYTNVYQGIDIPNLRAGTHAIRIVEVHGRGRNNRPNGREVLFDGSLNIPFESAVFAHLTPNYSLRVSEIKRLAIQPNRGNYRSPNRNRPVVRNNNRGVNNFMIAKRQIRQAAFDRNKLAIAKQFVRGSRPTSAEVGELMRLMSFDRTKLDLAKFAYAFTIDKQNYRLVNRSFTFDSSVRQLNRFLLNQHPQNQRTRRRR